MFDVTPIPAFNDNYLWLLRAHGTRECGIVDPGDAAPVLKALQDNDLTLAAIFITHHHADHTGGISRLLQEYDVPVYGPDSANIPAVTHKLAQDDSIEVFGKQFHILDIPGHTLDHIAYYAEASDDDTPLLFCGDTLFAGGCGRVFEGTYSMMHQSLQKLAVLPPETRVFCAHEYTLANLKFAHAVTPESTALAARIDRDNKLRQQDMPTVPTTIAAELQTNPFLRCSEGDVAAAAANHSGQSQASPEAVFAVIRQWKDGF
jgi:hydroxyacylglutathione hydrolase